MKARLRVGLIAVLAVVFFASVVSLVRQQLEYRGNAEIYQKAERIAQTPPDTPAPAGRETEDEEGEAPSGIYRSAEEERYANELLGLNIPALREVNPEVVGWIRIPNTELTYPFLQGRDNSFYLSHGWEKTANGAGSIYMDWRFSRGFEDFNTIIYGHQMNNDTMFSALKYYKDQSFWEKHPTIYICDGETVKLYDVFSAWKASVTSVVYTTDFSNEEMKREFLDAALAGSVLDTGIIPAADDHILTLSTCTPQGSRTTRWVVQAVERKAE